MQIIFFDNEKNVMDRIPFVTNPRALSLTQIEWESGGMSTDDNYVIVEDDRPLEDVSEEEFLQQKKIQTLLSIANDYDRRYRIEALAFGYESEERESFDIAQKKIKEAESIEEITVARNEYQDQKHRQGI